MISLHFPRDRKTKSAMRRFPTLIVLSLLGTLLTAPQGAKALDEWPHWGGTERSFQATTNLSTPWPAEGPRELWRQPLGEGYSSIVVAAGRVFAFYRVGDQERLAAFHAEDGKPVWTLAHQEPAARFNDRHGQGPNSTPAIRGDRIFAATSSGKLFAANTSTGELLWERPAEPVGNPPEPGRAGIFSASVLLVGDLVVAPVPKEGIVALSQETGQEVWATEGSDAAPSSIQTAELSGRTYLVAFLKNSLVGLDPANGSELWSVPHENPQGANILTPVILDEGLIFVSSGPDKGSQLVQVSLGTEEDFQAKSLWQSERLRVFYTNAVVHNRQIIGSNGGVSQALLTAASLESGEILWRNRDLGRVNLVSSGEFALALGDGGTLSQVRFSEKGAEVLASHEIFTGRSWTPPTLVGHRVYLWDLKNLVVLEVP